MGDANSIRTLGDYSKPSHEVYKNTIELLEGNNVVAVDCQRSFLSCLDFLITSSILGNGYLRKGQNRSQNGQNRAREQKEHEEKSKSEQKSKVKKSKRQSQPKSMSKEEPISKKC
ncbi:hypothetical protein Tco_1024431 [Tanacetum coccineum]